MCTVCGCSEGESRIQSDPHHNHQSHSQQSAAGHEHKHCHSHDQSHEHAHNHDHEHHHHYGQGPARAHAPGMDQARMVQIEQDILGKNNQYATANRQLFTEKGIFALNLVSSPGSGKTTLLTRTLTDLVDTFPLAVIEGDQETSQDAERIRKTGVPAIQVNTGKGCHLDGHMVGRAIESISPADGTVLFIENVGNLVCPAAFDLGEAHKVAILSVTEGEDKPIKYPDMFYAADVLLLNKIDLLPYLDFDVQRCIDFARQVNPSIQVIQLSATSGEGMEQWYQWVKLTRKSRLIGHPLASSNTLSQESTHA